MAQITTLMRVTKKAQRTRWMQHFRQIHRLRLLMISHRPRLLCQSQRLWERMPRRRQMGKDKAATKVSPTKLVAKRPAAAAAAAGVHKKRRVAIVVEVEPDGAVAGDG